MLVPPSSKALGDSWIKVISKNENLLTSIECIRNWAVENKAGIWFKDEYIILNS